MLLNQYVLGSVWKLDMQITLKPAQLGVILNLLFGTY